MHERASRCAWRDLRLLSAAALIALTALCCVQLLAPDAARALTSPCPQSGSGGPPEQGDQCISLPVQMVPVTSSGNGGCGQALFMQVPLELDKGIVEYVAAWDWGIPGANPPASNPWIFTAGGGKDGVGSGPYAGEQTWSTTALTPQNTGVNVHYTVPGGFGAWFVAAGGGSPPCPVRTGEAVAWAWVANECALHAADGAGGQGPFAVTATPPAAPKHCTSTTIKCQNTTELLASNCYVTVTDKTPANPRPPTGSVIVQAIAPNPNYPGARQKPTVSASYKCGLSRTPGRSQTSTICVVHVLVGGTGTVRVSARYVPDDGLHKPSQSPQISYTVGAANIQPLSFKENLQNVGTALVGVGAVTVLAGGAVYVGVIGAGAAATGTAGATAAATSTAFGWIGGVEGALGTLIGGGNQGFHDPPTSSWRLVASVPRVRPTSVPTGSSTLARTTRQVINSGARMRALFRVAALTLNRAAAAARASDYTAWKLQLAAAARQLRLLASAFDQLPAVQARLAAAVRGLGAVSLSPSQAQASKAHALRAPVISILRALGQGAGALRGAVSAISASVSADPAAGLTALALIAAERKAAGSLRALAGQPALAAFPTGRPVRILR